MVSQHSTDHNPFSLAFSQTLLPPGRLTRAMSRTSINNINNNTPIASTKRQREDDSSEPDAKRRRDDSSPEQKRNKLGYQRSTIACGNCRRRKIRCIVSTDDPNGKCAHCTRLHKDCRFLPVDQSAPRPKKKRELRRHGQDDDQVTPPKMDLKTAMGMPQSLLPLTRVTMGEYAAPLASAPHLGEIKVSEPTLSFSDPFSTMPAAPINDTNIYHYPPTPVEADDLGLAKTHSLALSDSALLHELNMGMSHGHHAAGSMSMAEDLHAMQASASSVHRSQSMGNLLGWDDYPGHMDPLSYHNMLHNSSLPEQQQSALQATAADSLMSPPKSTQMPPATYPSPAPAPGQTHESPSLHGMDMHLSVHAANQFGRKPSPYNRLHVFSPESTTDSEHSHAAAFGSMHAPLTSSASDMAPSLISAAGPPSSMGGMASMSPLLGSDYGFPHVQQLGSGSMGMAGLAATAHSPPTSLPPASLHHDMLAPSALDSLGGGAWLS